MAAAVGGPLQRPRLRQGPAQSKCSHGSGLWPSAGADHPGGTGVANRRVRVESRPSSGHSNEVSTSS